MKYYQTSKLTLTDITRYDDVEVGKLLLTVGSRQKAWEAVWLSDLRLDSRGNRNLPRGDLPISYKSRQHWIDCPRVKLSHRLFVWIEPLDTLTWTDMGVNIYLCSPQGWPHPLPLYEYEKLVFAMMSYEINMLSIEEPKEIISGNKYRKNELLGLEDFWDSSR